MHYLFTKVLSKKDLSRAGELFSVADSEIEHELTDVLTEIEAIVSQKDYLQNNNDQSVVEICVTRVISCIRETKSAERHCPALIILLESCLKHNLQPLVGKNADDPPHAKISADIISSIFLNYKKKTVMELALPVAVKFLEKGNKELSRNLASYLSLAAIEYAYLLSPHVQPIIASILSGNNGLCRVLGQIYEVSPEPFAKYIKPLIDLMSRCDVQEKLALLNLFSLIAKYKPMLLESSVNELNEQLADTATVSATMTVLLRLTEQKPHLIVDHFDTIKAAALNFPTTISQAAQILAAAGKVSKDHAQVALDFTLEHLSHVDRASQMILLHEATLLCSAYPVLFTDKVLACVRQRNNQSQQQPGKTSQSNHITQTSGPVTIIKLNAPPPPPSSPLQVSQSGLGLGSMSAIKIATSSNASSSVSATTNSVPLPINQQLVVSTTKVSNVVPTVPPVNGVENNNAAPNAVVNYGGGGGGGVGGGGGNTASSGGITVPPTPPHTGYTRRAKLGDSKSTGRLHPGGNTHRSMTRLNIAGGSIGGLHKSMTRLSSSQLINQNGSGSSNQIIPLATGGTSQNYVTPVPPLSSNVIVTGHNKWGIPSTKITSGGVTVTTSPPRGIRHHSHGPGILLGSSGALGKNSTSNNGISGLNQSTGSIGMQQQPLLSNNSVSVHHVSPASPNFQNSPQTVMTLPILSTPSYSPENQVSVSGPLTVTSRRNDNTSVTLLNANSGNQRMSVFEPYPMRDTIQHFCEKHLDKIKKFMDGVGQRLPPPAKCTIEERRSKKSAKLYFGCQARGPHCLYSKTFFTMTTRNPRIWIHLMFLDLQARAQNALSSRETGVSSLRHCWDILKCENKSFVALVTSAFPISKDQDTLVNELRNSGFFDVFELGPTNASGASIDDLQVQWGCFLCNHPEKAIGFLHGNNQPVIEGQLKEKKGKWRLFRRWRTRYFTLSGAHLSCKGSSGGESIDVNQIRSVKVSRGARNIPKAFEIFTGDQTLILKPKDGKNAEEWVQCLSIVVAHSQARDNLAVKTNSLPARGLGNSRTAF